MPSSYRLQSFCNAKAKSYRIMKCSCWALVLQRDVDVGAVSTVVGIREFSFFSYVVEAKGEKKMKKTNFIIPGNDRSIELVVKKDIDASDYTLKFKLTALNINNFLANFRIETTDMISSDLSFSISQLGLATLVMQEPDVSGLFSPGGGFEIVASGQINAPELPADASKFYLIIQDFKSGSSDSPSQGYGKPIAAIFAQYKSKEKASFNSIIIRFLPNAGVASNCTQLS